MKKRDDSIIMGASFHKEILPFSRKHIPKEHILRKHALGFIGFRLIIKEYRYEKKRRRMVSSSRWKQNG